MDDLRNKNGVGISPKKPSLGSLAFAIALAGFSLTVQAGKITSVPSASGADGFGGWNLSNVNILLDGTNSSFSEGDGSYIFDTDSDFSYKGDVSDDVGVVLGEALAKDWPVGEPSGIKIVNDDTDVKEGKPENCIMSTSYLADHFLDSADPKQVPCSGPFQSHKRYKLAMLPTTVVDGAGQEKGIDLVFNVEQDETSRDYQVFQKINNWTDGRLQGFTVQVGTGLGVNFVAAAATDPVSGAVVGVGVGTLSVSVPSAVWHAKQLANFSSGLFGPIDTSHGRPAGYFDPVDPAGFFIEEYGVGSIGDESGQTDTLTAINTLGSDYADVPPGTAAASVTANQFGSWLPDNMLPYGIFFDDDNNPETDAELIAWYGYNPNPLVADFGWMEGAAGSFAEIPDAEIINKGENLAYTMGEIDDLVNVGLNYVVTIADISGFPDYVLADPADPLSGAATFTIRITPTKQDPQTPAPGYVAEGIPDPSLKFTSSNGVVAIDPSPTFNIGDLLTARVGDADLNNDPLVAETVDVAISSTEGGLSGTLTLIEQGVDRGVFAASLPAEYSDVAVGVAATVTVKYVDTDIDGDGVDAVPTIKEAETSIEVALPAGALQFDPVTYTVAENDGNAVVTVTRIDGAAGEVTVEYETVSGTAVGGEDYISDAGSLTFADTVASQTITVVLIDDTAVEPDKDFSILLSNVLGGATLGDADTATVTITDSDVLPPGSLQFNPVSYSVARDGGSITLTVERTDGTAGEATVDYLTLSGTAIGGQDFVIQTGTLTFVEGSSTSQPITVGILDDTTANGDEVFTIKLSNVQVADMGVADLATVTITDTSVLVPTKGDGIFSFGWITTGLVLIGLLGRVRRRTVNKTS